jgi:serine protease Do
VVVVGVDPSGAAAAKGIEAGDVILAVGGEAVSNPADVKADFSKAKRDGKKIVLLRVKSQQGTHFVALDMREAG